MTSEISRGQLVRPLAHFSQQLSSTRRGARLARLLAVQQLTDWGWARDGETVETAALLVAELAANAVLHGRVAGRDFRVTLTVEPDLSAPAFLRIAVADCRGERPPARLAPPGEEECGRGLLLVEALAAHWGVSPRLPSGKTVWAELPLLPAGGMSASGAQLERGLDGEVVAGVLAVEREGVDPRAGRTDAG